MKEKNKKSLVLWADDDWYNFPKKEIVQQFVGGVLGVFHTRKGNCYEGKPRKVRITIEELL